MLTSLSGKEKTLTNNKKTYQSKNLSGRGEYTVK